MKDNILLAIAGFFLFWYMLSKLRGSSKNPLLWWFLLFYALIVAPLTWWYSLPPIERTITLRNINTSDWDKFLGIPSLKGMPVIDLVFPPMIKAQFEKDKLYGFLFQIGHHEYGTDILTGCAFSLFPPKELEIEKTLDWSQTGNPASRYRTHSQIPIEVDAPSLLPVFRFRAMKSGHYLFTYEIQGMAQNANLSKTPITVTGRFVVYLRSQ